MSIRVLHLPVNIASLPLQTVQAERELGLDSWVCEWGYSAEQPAVTSSDLVRYRQLPTNFRTVAGLRAVVDFAAQVSRADIIHWYAGCGILPRNLDTRVIEWMGKPGVIEWTGSEIRDPVLEAADNPVFAERLEKFPELVSMWDAGRARELQMHFDAMGFVPVAATGMVQYVLPEFMQKVRVVDRAISVAAYTPVFPEAHAGPLRIVHAPTSKVIKGSDLVQAAVEEVSRFYDIDFSLMYQLNRSETLQILANADIVIDQMILGDYGMLGLEAMALGKPVVSFIKPSLREAYGAALPIISAAPGELAGQLMILCADPDLRSRLGRAGRAYVEKHADTAVRAKALQRIYEEILGRR